MLDKQLINNIANALINVDPVKLDTHLKHVPDGEAIPSIGVHGAQIPLHYIPICMEIAIDNPEEWTPACIDKTKSTLQRNTEIKQMLSVKFSGFSFDEEIPFVNYGADGYNFIYSNEEDASLEDVFFSDETDQLTKFGATQLDVDLFCACTKFQFDEVKRLLELGANPGAEICVDDEEWTCFDRIGDEGAFVGGYIYSIIIQSSVFKMKGDDFDLVADLISLAAHEKMYSLLDKYRKD